MKYILITALMFSSVFASNMMLKEDMVVHRSFEVMKIDNKIEPKSIKEGTEPFYMIIKKGEEVEFIQDSFHSYIMQVKYQGKKYWMNDDRDKYFLIKN